MENPHENDDRRSWVIVEKLNARSKLWKYFKVYSQDRLPGLAICSFCYANGLAQDHYEIKIGETKSTSPMLQHLKFTHRDVWQVDLLKDDLTSVEDIFSKKFHVAMLKWILLSSMPPSVCEDKHFRAMCETLKPKHYEISKPRLFHQAAQIQQFHDEVISNLLKKEYTSITNHSWCVNGTDHCSATNCSFINAEWELVRLSLNYTRSYSPVVNGTRIDQYSLSVALADNHIPSNRIISVLKAKDISTPVAAVGDGWVCFYGFIQQLLLPYLSSERAMAAVNVIRLMSRYMLSNPHLSNESPDSQPWEEVLDSWWSIHAGGMRVLACRARLTAARVAQAVQVSEECWPAIEAVVLVLKPFMIVKWLFEHDAVVNCSFIPYCLHKIKVELKALLLLTASQTAYSSSSTTSSLTSSSSNTCFPSSTSSAASTTTTTSSAASTSVDASTFPPATSSVPVITSTATLTPTTFNSTASTSITSTSSLNHSLPPHVCDADGHLISNIIRNLDTALKGRSKDNSACLSDSVYTASSSSSSASLPFSTSLPASDSSSESDWLFPLPQRLVWACALDPRVKLLGLIEEGYDEEAIWTGIETALVDMHRAKDLRMATAVTGAVSSEVSSVPQTVAQSPSLADIDAAYITNGSNNSNSSNSSSSGIYSSSSMYVTVPYIPSQAPMYPGATPSMSHSHGQSQSPYNVGPSPASVPTSASSVTSSSSNAVQPTVQSSAVSSAFSEEDLLFSAFGSSRVEASESLDRVAVIRARQELTCYRMLDKQELRSSRSDEGASERFSNPLQWWQQHCHLFPLLSALARRMLAMPATAVPSEALFSAAGYAGLRERMRSVYSANLAELSDGMLCLKDNWAVVEEALKLREGIGGSGKKRKSDDALV